MMKNYNRSSINGVFLSILLITNIAYAENNASIKYFVSNNREEINLETAYERLYGEPQAVLENSTIDVLQKNHVEQGRFENVLGTYEMASDKNMTGDNTEIFTTSPLQNFSDEKNFDLAKQLANTFQQESVAVFIPDAQGKIADVTVQFHEDEPSISEAVKLIHEKLPAHANAFSIHISHACASFAQAKVSEIEWLGSTISIDEMNKAFPQDLVSSFSGQAYLVYKNGEVDKL